MVRAVESTCSPRWRSLAGAEMVVVGTSLPRLATRILGSNAQAVVLAVRCAVLVVHAAD